jgi:hypothetical protein
MVESQNIPVRLTAGLDTKDDPKSLQAKLLYLQNASFQSPGQIQKRDGFSSLTQNVLDGIATTSGTGIAAYQNELVSMDGLQLYSYSSEINKQVSKGELIPVTLSTSAISRNIYAQTQPDYAYHSGSGLKCFVWTDTYVSGGTIKYSIVDSVTDATIVNNAHIDYDEPEIAKVMTVGNYFVIFYRKNAGGSKFLKYVAIDVSTPSTLGSPVTLFSSAGTVPYFDIVLNNGSLYIAYTNDATHITLYSLDSSLVLSSSYVILTTLNVKVISLKQDSSNNIWLAYANDSFELHYLIINSALNTIVLADTLAITSAYQIMNITQIVTANTSSIIYYEVLYPASYKSNYINYINVLSSGSIGPSGTLSLGLGLASKAFKYNSRNYMLAIYYGSAIPDLNSVNTLVTIEPTYFLIDEVGAIIAKLAPSIAGPMYISGILPEVVSLSASNFGIAYLEEYNTTSINGVINFQTGVMSSGFEFNIPYPIQKLVMAGNLHLASGQLWMYDGQTVAEHGYHIYPENLSSAGTASGGGIGPSLNAGTVINEWQYAAVYEWADNKGQLHRSAPSLALIINIGTTTPTPVTFTASSTANSSILSTVSSFTGLYVGQVLTDSTNPTNLTAGTYIKTLDTVGNRIILSLPATGTHAGDTYSTKDTMAISVRVPTLRQTLKTNVSITLYRTVNNGSIFYRVTSPTIVAAANGLTYNDKTIDYVTIVDKLPDSVALGNEELYTTGGEVPNINAPAVSSISSFKNRAIFTSPENPYQIGYSKQVIPGSPVEFDSLEFVQNIDQQIGSITATKTIDDKLIIFGPTSKWYIVGQGPTPSGTNNDFSEATKIAGSSGCSNPASIIEIPIGLLYQDINKGIYLLDRSLVESYIGADVEAYNGISISSVQKFENQNKVIFTLSTGVNLVYDYYVGQWEIDPFASAAIDSTIFENDLTYIQSNGLILQQTPGTFSDNGSVIPIQLQTGWISVAGLEGFSRVKELQIMGTYFSPHTLTVDFYTDFNSVAVQTVSIPVLSDPGLYQFRIILQRQKCESIMIKITETQSGSPGRGFSLSSLAFRVGVKKGMNKLPAKVSY